MQAVLERLVLYVFIAGAGVALRYFGLVKREDRQVLINIMVNLTLPCAIISGFAGARAESTFLILIAFSLAYHLVNIVIAMLRTRGKPGVDRSSAIIHASALNIGNFSMPMMQLLMPPLAFIYAGIFDIVCSVFSLGVNYALASHYANNTHENLFKDIVGKLLRSIPMLVYLVALPMMIFGWQFPGIVYDVTGQVAKANVVLAMLLAGISIDIHIPKDWLKPIIATLVIRYAVGAGFAVLGFLLFRQSPVLWQTLAMCFTAPYSNAILFFSKECRCDPRFSAALLGISTIITLGIYMVLQLLWF